MRPATVSLKWTPAEGTKGQRETWQKEGSDLWNQKQREPILSEETGLGIRNLCSTLPGATPDATLPFLASLRFAFSRLEAIPIVRTFKWKCFLISRPIYTTTS